MNRRDAVILLLLSTLTSAGCVYAYARWMAPADGRPLAVLDLGELYRLKERQVTELLTKPDTTDGDRLQGLQHASAFGAQVTELIRVLQHECRCLILARGAVIGAAGQIPDLTPEVQRRLGLQDK